MGRFTVFGMLVFCLGASGCASNDVLLKKQMETDSRLEQVLQGRTADNARIAKLDEGLKSLQEQLKTLSSDLEQVRKSGQETASSTETLTRRMSALSTQVGKAKIEVVNQETSPAEKDSAQQAAYMKAFGLFSANNFTEAIAGFEEYLKAFPDGEYAGNAQYWIGECFYTQKNYREALAAFERVVAVYQKSSKVPDAMLKIGYSLISFNEPQKAKSALQSLIEKFPKSQAAVKAREKLARLNTQ
jgi:tol-pal system protein YbgF